MENVSGIKVVTVEYLEISIIRTKSKTITYTDEELDDEEVVVVEVPLRKPLIQVRCSFVTDTELIIGAAYGDDNKCIYRATSKTHLLGDIQCHHYSLPEKFILLAKPITEGSNG